MPAATQPTEPAGSDSPTTRPGVKVPTLSTSKVLPELKSMMGCLGLRVPSSTRTKRITPWYAS